MEPGDAVQTTELRRTNLFTKPPLTFRVNGGCG